MSEGLRTVDNTAKRWVLVTGSRVGLAALLSVVVVALSLVLVATDLIYVGPGSNLSNMLPTGLMAGLLTLVTVALSINQLILSRVFGTVNELSEAVEASVAFRTEVETIAGVRRSPNAPGDFLALVGRSLTDRATQVRQEIDESAAEAGLAREFLDDVADYGEHLERADESDDTFETLTRIMGSTYAELLAEGERVKPVTDGLWPDEGESLDDVLALLQAVATVRQFFKTLTIQQDMARLSRHLIYSGFVAVLVTYFFAQVYTASPSLPTTIPAGSLPVLASLVAGIAVFPLAVLVSYLLRVSTVSLYTVSTGAFVPPVETFGD